MQITVTDLTRLDRKKNLLCLAGITKSGKCIRPLMKNSRPGYLNYETCKKYNILPGTILESVFTKPDDIEAPHVEDRHFTALNVVGSASSEDFKVLLAGTSHMSIREGFGCKTQPASKLFTSPPERSIITLRLNPKLFSITHDQYDTEKIKAHLTDGDGLGLRYLSITDLGFYDNVGRVSTRKISAEGITEFINYQDELYVRLGLSRWYRNPDGREGYWMQINGIYTFPEFDRVVRSY